MNRILTGIGIVTMTALLALPAASAHSWIAIDTDGCDAAVLPPNPAFPSGDGHAGGVHVGAGAGAPCVIVVVDAYDPFPEIFLP